ncbi:MAG: ECF transporter S component [Synergistaceae bacterium]|nr:ECF transporter S component [Synergistaceae bacterium]
MTERTRDALTGARGVTTTALLSAAAGVLMFLDFALPIFPTFIKMDISNVPALIASFAMGPRAAVAVEFIKNVFNISHTSTGGVGEMASFVIGVSYVVPAGIIYRRHKTMKRACASMAAGVLVSTCVAATANYFVLIPLYSRIIPMETIIGAYMAVNPYATTLGRVVIMSVVPFNLLKGTVAAFVTMAVYKRLSPIIKG